MQIVSILKSIKEKLNKLQISQNKREKLQKTINELIEKYNSIEIDNGNAVYQGLIKKGKDISKSTNIMEIENYIKYCQAAVYDLTGNIKPLNTIFRAYLITSVLFMLLAPQYLGPILPLIFVVPIYFGVKGLKQRSATGLTLMLSVLPMGLLTSVVWLKNASLAINQGNTFFEQLSSYYKMSMVASRNLFIFFVVLSVLLLVSSVYTFMLGLKHRKMFI